MIDPGELMALADAAVDEVVPRLMAARHRTDLHVTTKSSGTDMVTEMDRWAEETLTSYIRAVRPDDGFLGEEGTVEDGTSGVVWLIDPIDGTTNYLYDLPGSSVSVAASVDGVVEVGLVHDLIRDERFRAVRGRGATVGQEPIGVSRTERLDSALVASGFSYDSERRRRQAMVLVELLPRVRDLRRFGGAAVDLCSVGAGRVDAFYERGLNLWDHAAGGLIATEAGARLREQEGGALIAATPLVFDDLVDLLESAGVHDA